MRTWMWPAALAGLLAGCRFEPVGASPDDGGPPPPPDVMVDAAVDAPPDATTDRDGDGVRDDDDNCIQMPNPGQENCDGDEFGDACDVTSDGPDEDGDTIADACDNCPTVFNTDQFARRDDDEVGDACDPQPDDGGDTIAYFNAFNEDSGGAPPEGWSLATGEGLVDGQWRVAGQRLLHEATAEPSILYLSEEVPADVFIEAKFTVDDFLPGGDAVAFLGTLSRYTNGLASEGTDEGYLCTLRQGVGNSTATVRIQDLANAAGDEENTLWSGQIGQRYTIAQTQIGAVASVSSRCTVTPDDPLLLYESVRRTNISGPASGSVALRAQRISVAFDHIVVYGLDVAPPAPPTSSSPARHPAP